MLVSDMPNVVRDPFRKCNVGAYRPTCTETPPRFFSGSATDSTVYLISNYTYCT